MLSANYVSGAVHISYLEHPVILQDCWYKSIDIGARD